MNRTRSPATRGGFVTPMAWVSLLLGVASALTNLLQILLIGLVPGSTALPLPPGMRMPASWQWLIDHAMSLSVLGAVLSVAFAWMSWALLQRREWARIGFVLVLVVTGLLNFGGLALIGPLFDGLQSMLPADILHSPEWPQMQARLQTTRLMALLLTGLGALVIALFQCALAWRLCAPAVRAGCALATGLIVRLESRLGAIVFNRRDLACVAPAPPAGRAVDPTRKMPSRPPCRPKPLHAVMALHLHGGSAWWRQPGGPARERPDDPPRRTRHLGAGAKCTQRGAPLRIEA